LNFEIVDETISVTGSGKDELKPVKEPNNLDFEK
jgi:hypothetical protein